MNIQLCECACLCLFGSSLRLAMPFALCRLGILYQADVINRYEKWPKYKFEIARMVKSGNPPEFYDPKRPLGALFHMAANDRNFWIDNVIEPCRKPTLTEANEAAIAHRSDHLPL